MGIISFNGKTVKRAIICKNVNDTILNQDIIKTYKPKAGDVAIFKVLSIGKHTRMQVKGARNSFLVPGDFIMCAFGTRYATNQLEGYVPTYYLKEYDILGQGGVVGQMTSIHSKFEAKGSTKIELIGYVTDKDGNVQNTKELAGKLTPFRAEKTTPSKIILSLGTSMDSGKTSTAAFLANGLSKAGKKVAYVKLTGTVYLKDKHYVQDHGAFTATDFSDYGFPSTFMCENDELLDLHQTLVDDMDKENPDYIIMEIADGILGRETKALIEDERFKNHVHSVIFSAGDSMSALMGEQFLKNLGYDIIGISGLFTIAPLLKKEVELQTKTPIHKRENLMEASILDAVEEAVAV